MAALDGVHAEGLGDAAADRLLELALAAPAGSDAQLQFTTAFADHARTDAQLDTLEAMLEGERVPAGLTIDQDLRWELLTGLVVGVAQDLLEVRLAGGREALVPFVEAIVTDVDTEQGRVVVDAPAGLFDLDES